MGLPRWSSRALGRHAYQNAVFGLDEHRLARLILQYQAFRTLAKTDDSRLPCHRHAQTDPFFSTPHRRSSHC